MRGSEEVLGLQSQNEQRRAEEPLSNIFGVKEHFSEIPLLRISVETGASKRQESTLLRDSCLMERAINFLSVKIFDLKMQR